MTSKAFGLAQLGNVYADGALSNRNLIINGAMQVWQRGTSFTPNPVIFGADRFAAYKAVASAGDYARSTDVPAGQGFTYSGYFNAADIRHSVELPATGERGVFVDGSQWTLSFWVKAGASGTATANLGWANGVSASSLTYWGADQSYSYSTSWEKKTITFTVSGSITGSHAAVLLYMSAVSGGLYITGVQLEAGDTATPFEHRSFGQELALCQRYFCKTYNYETIPGTATAAGNLFNSLDATQSYGYSGQFSYPVSMRATPTIVVYNPNNGVAGQLAADGNNLSASANTIGTDRCAVGVSNISIGQSNYVRAHATASAEL
jgi:hypothetical protein